MIRPAFNRPVLFVTLLSEQAKDISITHAVYSSIMTDEFTLRTPDALLNGLATELLITNCCPDIQNVKLLPICDIQYILASIRIASNGPELTVDLKCPKCLAVDPYSLDLQGNLPQLSAKIWYNSFVVEDFVLTFCPPSLEE